MTKSLHILGALSLMTVLSGCLMTRTDVKEVEQKKAIQEQVISLQKNNADSGSKLQDVDDQMRNFSGRVEVLENRMGIVTTENQARKEQSLDVNKRVQVLQDEIIRLDQNMQALRAEIQQLKSQPAPAKGSSGGSDSFAAAEDLFASKDWKKAILAYQKYRDDSPKGKKFPEATYKIGVCFQELGLKDEARTFYEEVVAKFPDSVEAKKAKTRIKSLKK